MSKVLLIVIAGLLVLSIYKQQQYQHPTVKGQLVAGDVSVSPSWNPTIEEVRAKDHSLQQLEEAQMAEEQHQTQIWAKAGFPDPAPSAPTPDKTPACPIGAWACPAVDPSIPVVVGGLIVFKKFFVRMAKYIS